MAATTLPVSFSRHINTTNGTSFDEWGAHSIPPSTSNHDFDEEIVPALKRRLEEESLRLESRMNRLDVHKNVSARRIPRLDRNNEIIQDGLGSDDLIPSAWATGSSAQFAKAPSRGRNRTEEIERSFSATHYSPVSNVSPTLHQNQAMLMPSSPPSHSNSPRGSHMQEAPPSPSTGENHKAVSKARVMARRLAREREGMVMEQSASMNDQMNATYSWEESGDDEERREDYRKRTLSTPTVYRSEGNEKDSRYPPLPMMDFGRKQYHSKPIPRDGDVMSSKIPLPTSGSMSKYQDQSNHSNRELSKSKSLGRFASAATPPHQDGLEEGEGNEGTYGMGKNAAGSIGIGGRREENIPQQIVDYSPPTQDVLDQFGPLGGTPKKGRGLGWEVNEVGQMSAADKARSVSNPWDEELLPTVKKRLEQQRLLQDLSKDDGLVDTWDRNGLPLSKSPSQKVKTRARIERETKSSEPSELLQDKQINSAEGESYMRMKRLQEQLGIEVGSDSEQQAMQREQREDLYPSVEGQEMQNGGLREPHRGDRPTSVAQRVSPSVTAAEQKQSASADPDVGCCKCTIM
ncbi:hypothetical protein CBS101457_001682 [Exobasidium rhododendri]|nr:hypothetical protein CBS101457_001682 [Exobasidium rhododendri]